MPGSGRFSLQTFLSLVCFFYVFSGCFCQSGSLVYVVLFGCVSFLFYLFFPRPAGAGLFYVVILVIWMGCLLSLISASSWHESPPPLLLQHRFPLFQLIFQLGVDALQILGEIFDLQIIRFLEFLKCSLFSSLRRRRVWL